MTKHLPSISIYKTAEELGISEELHLALIDVISDLLHNSEDFSMRYWSSCLCSRLPEKFKH